MLKITYIISLFVSEVFLNKHASESAQNLEKSASQLRGGGVELVGHR